MTSALLDTNIILDLFLDRMPFVDEAAKLWEANEKGRFVAYVSAITPVNLFYIARKIKGAADARKAVSELLSAMQVCMLDYAVLQSAQNLPFGDYEDAVQHASATNRGLDAIVTRNLKDFTSATIPVFSPGDFLKTLP